MGRQRHHVRGDWWPLRWCIGGVDIVAAATVGAAQAPLQPLVIDVIDRCKKRPPFGLQISFPAVSASISPELGEFRYGK